MKSLRLLDRTLLVLGVVVGVGLTGCSRKHSPPASGDQPAPPAADQPAPPAADQPAPPAAPTEASGLPTIQAADLAAELKAGGDKPLLIHVGFHTLYQQAHIPGSEYIGPTSEDAALQKLRARVEKLPKDASIVIYCGCCPWSHCPNVKPAAAALAQMGFTNAKVLYIGHNFGADWADHGYPVATGD